MYNVFMNSALLVTLNNSLPVFSTLLVVLFLRSKGVFGKKEEKALSPIIFKLVLPFFVFNAMYSIALNISDLPILFFLFVINLIQVPVLYAWGRVQGMKNTLLGSVLLLALAYSIGPIAYPFVQLNFDSSVFSTLVSIDLMLFLSILIFGPIIAAYFDQDKNAEIISIAKSLVTDPILIAAFLAATVRLLGISLPISILNSVDFISTSFTFLVTVFVGLSLTIPNLGRVNIIVMGTFLRFLFAGLVFVLTGLLFNPTEVMLTAIALAFFMAFSAFPIVYTEKHRLDSELIAQASVFSRVLIYLLYPLLITFLKMHFS
jgi:predicted permease